MVVAIIQYLFSSIIILFIFWWELRKVPNEMVNIGVAKEKYVVLKEEAQAEAQIPEGKAGQEGQEAGQGQGREAGARGGPRRDRSGHLSLHMLQSF